MCLRVFHPSLDLLLFAASSVAIISSATPRDSEQLSRTVPQVSCAVGSDDFESGGGQLFMPPCSADPKPARRQLPPQTEYWRSKFVERPDGLRVWRSERGDEFINVGVFGEDLQAVQRGVDLTKRQAAALKWLTEHAEQLPGGEGALIWRSNYETNYNALVFEPPWSGGYGQASIISGFLALHEADPNAGWLDRAVRAGLAYDVPTTDGGLGERLPNGCIWFEELTSPAIAKAGLSPHICNGHIYATLHLLRLAKVSGNSRIQQLAEEGQRSLKLMMRLFDNGTWIRYDLSPRRWDIRFCLNYVADSVSGGVAPSSGPFIRGFELRRFGMHGEPTRLCVGVDGDDDGAWRIGDGKYGSEFGVVPWGGRERRGIGKEIETGRSLQTGKSVFVLELPPGADTDYFHEPFLQLRIFYRDSGSPGTLDAMIFSFREQVNNEYAELPGSPHRLHGDGQLRVLEKSVRLCDLASSSLTAWKVTNAYVKPLAALESITGDPFYREWRLRLEAQVRALAEAYPHLEFGKR